MPDQLFKMRVNLFIIICLTLTWNWTRNTQLRIQ